MPVKGKVLNIEVGDRLTKVCLSIPKGKSYQIKHSFMFQTPDNAVADGFLSAPDVMAAELKSQLEAHGLNDAKNAVFALTSGKVATREVTLPPVTDNRIKAIVDSNAGDYFPVDLAKYHVTESLLERTEKGENAGCRVLVFAAPLSLLENYFAMAEQTGLHVMAIDYSGNSQYQALRSLSGEGVSMFVNVDCNSSVVTFTQNGRLLLQRTFTFGGDELVLGYMNASGKAPTDYVDALHECSTQEPEFIRSGVMSPAEVSDSLSRLVSNIARSTDYYNSNHWDMQVEHVVLMGPCSHLVGLREMVANATGVTTDYLDDIPGVASFANEADSASFYISCIGSSIAPLDFIPPQFTQDKKAKRGKEKSEKNMLRDGAIVCGVCLVAAVALSAASMAGYSSARKEKAALEQQIADLQYVRDVYNTYISYQAGADALIALDAGIDSPNDALNAFITELEEKMPSQILVLSATCTRESVVLNATTPTYAEAAETLVQLRSFESLSDVQVSSITQETDEAGGSYVSFSVTAAYGVNPYLNSMNPYAVAPVATEAPAPEATDDVTADVG